MVFCCLPDRMQFGVLVCCEHFCSSSSLDTYLSATANSVVPIASEPETYRQDMVCKTKQVKLGQEPLKTKGVQDTPEKNDPLYRFSPQSLARMLVAAS